MTYHQKTAIKLNPNSSLKSNRQTIARLFIFTWFFIGAIAHFAIPEPFLRIMLPYIPFHLACVYISAAFDLICSVGLWVNHVPCFPVYGFISFTSIFSIATIHIIHPT